MTSIYEREQQNWKNMIDVLRNIDASIKILIKFFELSEENIKSYEGVEKEIPPPPPSPSYSSPPVQTEGYDPDYDKYIKLSPLGKALIHLEDAEGLIKQKQSEIPEDHKGGYVNCVITAADLAAIGNHINNATKELNEHDSSILAESR